MKQKRSVFKFCLLFLKYLYAYYLKKNLTFHLLVYSPKCLQQPEPKEEPGTQAKSPHEWQGLRYVSYHPLSAHGHEAGWGAEQLGLEPSIQNVMPCPIHTVA